MVESIVTASPVIPPSLEDSCSLGLCRVEELDFKGGKHPLIWVQHEEPTQTTYFLGAAPGQGLSSGSLVSE